MKISRKNLNNLIESLLNEDKLPPKYVADDKAFTGIRRQYDQLGDMEMQHADSTLNNPGDQEISNADLNLMNKAMIEYVKNPNSQSVGDVLDKLALSGVTGLSALGQLLVPTSGATPLFLPAITVGTAGLSGAFLGNFIDDVFRKDRGNFSNNVLRRAAGIAGLEADIGRYSQPSIEDIIATGFDGLKPNDVDPEFQRKLAIMHILTKTIKNDSDKPAIIKLYETFVEQGIIDGDAFEAIANDISEDFTDQIKQAASSR